MTKRQIVNLIIDGNNLAHRCRHTFSLSNHGIDVSVTYGVLRNIQSLMRKFHPYSISVCWDGGRPRFRTLDIPEYKAGRTELDDFTYENFLRQIRELSDYAFPLLGIMSVRKSYAEADDLIYHMSRMLQGKNIVITTDKDLIQCINGDVEVYHPFKDRIYTLDNFDKEFGISPQNFICWRALIGDGSDNIKGVNGIGEVTASKLFNKYGDLKTIYEEAANKDSSMSPKLRDSILSFGMDRIYKNMHAMDLEKDLTGARYAIIKAWEIMPTKHLDLAKRYMMRNAFVSLMDDFLWDLETIRKPSILQNVRIPKVCPERIPSGID